MSELKFVLAGLFGLVRLSLYICDPEKGVCEESLGSARTTLALNLNGFEPLALSGLGVSPSSFGLT